MSLRNNIFNAPLSLGTKKYPFAVYKSVFMLILANMQKIHISKVINQFPRVQISHKKVT